jgi:hypothetical protein
MIKEHCSLLASHLSVGPQWSRVLFAFLCAERLRPCCWVFGKEYSRDTEIGAFTCERIFNYLMTGVMSDDLILLNDDFPATIHSSDEFGTALAVQAQSGMTALANALELCLRDEMELATASGVYVIDAIDNFELFAWNSVAASGEFRESKEYWLLSTELARQIHQAAQVVEIGRAELIGLRIENRQYAIPPAIL